MSNIPDLGHKRAVDVGNALASIDNVILVLQDFDLAVATLLFTIAPNSCVYSS
jgi:hypothetical protein